MDRAAHHTIRRRRSGGLTLVELVLVLAIIATFTAVAAPRYINSVLNYRVNAAARRVLTDLEHARSRAKTASLSRTVAFDAANHRYTIVGESDPLGDSASYVVPLRAEPYKAIIRSMDLGGDGQVVFDGFGMPDAGGVIIVQAGTMRKAVDINGSTGEITIQEVTSAYLTDLTSRDLTVVVE